jgi:hypothetical protein
MFLWDFKTNRQILHEKDDYPFTSVGATTDGVLRARAEQA